MDPVLAASHAEVTELEDALVADDNWNRNGFGEVLWVNRDSRVLRRPQP